MTGPRDTEGDGVPELSLRSAERRGSEPPSPRRARAVLFTYLADRHPGEPLRPAGMTFRRQGLYAQSCAYRENPAGFRSAGLAVFGLSAQTAEAHAEFHARESIPLRADQ